MSGIWGYFMFQSISLSLTSSHSVSFLALSSLTPDHISLLNHTMHDSLIIALTNSHQSNQFIEQAPKIYNRLYKKILMAYWVQLSNSINF